jgi:hypothetical protein
MKISMISGLVLATTLVAQSAFALEHSQGKGDDQSWISTTRVETWKAATMSIGTASAKLPVGVGQATLLTNDGTKLLIDGTELKIVRVSGSDHHCGNLFGFVGVACTLDDAIVTIEDSKGDRTAVSAKAQVSWINTDIYVVIAGENLSLDIKR